MSVQWSSRRRNAIATLERALRVAADRGVVFVVGPDGRLTAYVARDRSVGIPVDRHGALGRA